MERSMINDSGNRFKSRNHQCNHETLTVSTHSILSLRSSIAKALAFITNHRRLIQIHAIAVTSGLAVAPFVAGKLIASYSIVRDHEGAASVFLSTPNSAYSGFLFNSVIRAHTRNGQYSKALDFYDRMVIGKVRVDALTFPSVVACCAGLGNVELGREVHRCALELGFGTDLYVGNSLISMYSRVGSLEEAYHVFDEMPERDIVSWNSLISGCSANGKWEIAVEVYGRFRSGGGVPDCFTVESVMPAFGGLGNVDDGEVIHGLIQKIGIQEDLLVSNGVLAMYCRFQNLLDARKIFDMMVAPDIVSWNTMIDGYYQSGQLSNALELFRQMIARHKPDLITISILLHICYSLEELKLGSSVHGYIMRNGYECDVAALNILLACYAKSGRVSMSHKLFDRIIHRDSCTWNSLISGYIDKGLFDQAIELFRSMVECEAKPDSVTMVMLISMFTKLMQLNSAREIHCDAIKRGFNSVLLVQNSLLDMYSKCGSLEDALEHFRRMEMHDEVSWNTIVSGCAHTGNCSLAFELLSQMKVEGQNLNKATILCILPACSFVAAKKQGKEIHGCILKLGLESEVSIGNALVEMYSKCGGIGYAVRVFECMNFKDIVTWTTMICAYGMYGQGDLALRLFSMMENVGIIPDQVAFLSVIYACSHTGLVEQGKEYFKRMKEDYNLSPNLEHYACIVDLLARSGNLVEAHKFIEDMPIEPDISIWGTLLSACHKFNDNSMAECVAEKIMDLNTDHTGYIVLMSNVYASLGKWGMVNKLRKSIKLKKLRKDPGYSWIEIRNKLYVFGTGDQSVEQSNEIHQLLEKLAELMAKEGYNPDRSFVLQDVEEDDKKYMLCTHSERLAIAFGLLNTEPGTPLQIMKNLRACGDCHTAIKYISKIVQREILVRDANRFHLFKEGSCSCGDYW